MLQSHICFSKCRHNEFTQEPLQWWRPPRGAPDWGWLWRRSSPPGTLNRPPGSSAWKTHEKQHSGLVKTVGCTATEDHKWRSRAIFEWEYPKITPQPRKKHRSHTSAKMKRAFVSPQTCADSPGIRSDFWEEMPSRYQRAHVYRCVALNDSFNGVYLVNKQTPHGTFKILLMITDKWEVVCGNVLRDM